MDHRDPKRKQAANKLAISSTPTMEKHDIAVHAIEYYKKQLAALKNEDEVRAIGNIIDQPLNTMISNADAAIISLKSGSHTALSDNSTVILKAMKFYVDALTKAQERIKEKLGDFPQEMKEIEIERRVAERILKES